MNEFDQSIAKEKITQMINGIEVISAISPKDILLQDEDDPLSCHYHAVIENFFTQLDDFWKDRNYIKNIEFLDADHIHQYDLGQLRAIITKIWRHEKFCDGSWADSLESGIFEDIRKRLLQLKETLMAE